MHLYRLTYAYPDGTLARATLAASPSQILVRASDYVRGASAELLRITELRALNLQLTLT